jgi:hypothetical protein
MSSVLGAIPFITYEESTGRFTVLPPALAYLRSLGERKLVIIACAGTYRTGKSYLLNALAHGLTPGGAVSAPAASSCFPVGSTVKACTKGLWLCPGRRLEGGGGGGGGGEGAAAGSDEPAVLYLDSEGMASTSRSETFDVRLFSLALLLSSVFLYNSVGTIDGTAISKLGLVAQLTRHIHTRAQPVGRAEDPGTDFASFFPAFLWVVRDMGVRLEREGRRITAKEYLEDALKSEDGLSEELDAKNAIRAMLRSFFPERDCVTLVRPCTEEAALKALGAVGGGGAEGGGVEPGGAAAASALRPEFRAGVESLRKRLAALAPHRCKALYGKALTGALLGRLAEAYAEALNAGGAPVIASAWERVVAAQCNEAAEAGARAYKDALAAAAGAGAGAARGGVLEEGAVLEAHAAGERAAAAAFSGVAVVGEGTRAASAAAEGRLRDAVWAEFARFRCANEAASAAHCEGLLAELGASAGAAVAGGAAGAPAQEGGAGAGVGAGSGASALGAGGAAEAACRALLPAERLPRALRAALGALCDAYAARAAGPAAPRALAAFLTARAPALFEEPAARVDGSVRAACGALRAWAGELSAALAAARAREAALVEEAAAERRAGESAVAEAARSGAEAAERLRGALAAREGELARATARCERLEAAAEGAARRAEEAAARATADAAARASRVEELMAARSDALLQVAVLTGKLTEAAGARGAAEREAADAARAAAAAALEGAVLAEKLRGAEAEGARLGERLRSAEAEAAQLRDALRAAQDAKNNSELRQGARCIPHPPYRAHPLHPPSRACVRARSLLSAPHPRPQPQPSAPPPPSSSPFFSRAARSRAQWEGGGARAAQWGDGGPAEQLGVAGVPAEAGGKGGHA